MAETRKLTIRECEVLQAVADAGRPLWADEIGQALGAKPNNYEKYRPALNSLVAGGLLISTRSADMRVAKRVYYDITDDGLAILGREVPHG